MIVNQELTNEQRQRSQRNINLFNTINGLSYMCAGETIMILLAVKLGFSDTVVAVLSGMIFFGFLLLPLGKIVSAHVGGARGQAIFWVARNFAALVMASATLWHRFGYMHLALACMVGGAFLFYGFRAAGIVMAQPLIGDIATEEERPRFIAINGALFYAACFVSLIIISIVLKFNDSTFSIALIITAGATLGFTSSTFLRRVTETRAIIESARRPVIREMFAIFHDRSIRRLLLGSFTNNLSTVMLLPVSILLVKKGYGMSDTGALLFSLLQFAASATMSVAVVNVSNRVGPRQTLIGAYAVMLITAIMWSLAPNSPSAAIPFLALLFTLTGSFRITAENSLAHYFLQTVSPERRVPASMLMNMVTGVGAGVTAMLISGWILYRLGKGVTVATPGHEMIHLYRRYFVIAFAILLPGLFILLRMEPLPIEKRRLEKAWTKLFRS